MRILNIGCGQQTYGTDFIDIIKYRPEIKICNVSKNKLPYKDDTFDVVYSRSLFEHLINPNQVLKEMVRVTKRGCKVIVITDNASFIGFAFLKTHLKNFQDPSRHYSLFTKLHVRNHFEIVGLNDIKVEDVYDSWAILKILSHIPIIGRLFRLRFKVEGTKGI